MKNLLERRTKGILASASKLYLPSSAMSTSVRVYTSELYQQATKANSDLMIISDQKEYFTSKFLDLTSVSGITEVADITFLTSVAEIRLTSSGETPSSTELFVRGLAATDPPRRVVLALLPSKYARHNTPSRSHSVASLVKNHKGSSKDLIVILAPSTGDYFFPQALAIGRQFPLYSLKSLSVGKEEKNPQVSILLHNSGYSQKLLDNMGNVVDGIRLAQRLVDSPPNVLHTDAYVEECLAVASRTGCKIEVCNICGAYIIVIQLKCIY